MERTPFVRTRHTINAVLVTAASIVALALPASANAGLLVSTAPSCDTQTYSQPFMPWADVASYTLQPGGDFEGHSTWSGGSVVSGNEPFDVGSKTDNHALGLAAGESSTSPSICVGIEHPDLRFFAQASNPTATLKVEVLFEDGFGNEQSATIGAVTGNSGWAPTAVYPLVVNLLPLLPGSHTAVAFRFTASGGSFQVDDVYVDPYSRW
jgi:hypothetical protein